jgi:hypothetical protein
MIPTILPAKGFSKPPVRPRACFRKFNSAVLILNIILVATASISVYSMADINLLRRDSLRTPDSAYFTQLSLPSFSTLIQDVVYGSSSISVASSPVPNTPAALVCGTVELLVMLLMLLFRLIEPYNTLDKGRKG